MKPHKRTGRAAKQRRQESAAERFDPTHKAQRWTCGHKHGEFIFAARCGINNAPIEDRAPRSPEERLLAAVFSEPRLGDLDPPPSRDLDTLPPRGIRRCAGAGSPLHDGDGSKETGMTTSEVLNKAADLIEKRGWIQAPGDGTEGDWWGEAEGSPVCLEGAIIAALGGEENEIDNVTVGECPAYLTVKDYLAEADRAHGRYLFMWNDEEDRTAAEVIEVLRACAVIEASRERQPAEVAS